MKKFEISRVTTDSLFLRKLAHVVIIIISIIVVVVVIVIVIVMDHYVSLPAYLCHVQANIVVD